MTEMNLMLSNFYSLELCVCVNDYTIYTQMQNVSNLRWPPKNKMSAKKQYFTISFIHLGQKAYQILPTFTNKCQ
jgi:hypothetical protein